METKANATRIKLWIIGAEYAIHKFVGFWRCLKFCLGFTAFVSYLPRTETNILIRKDYGKLCSKLLIERYGDELMFRGNGDGSRCDV